MTSSLIYRLLVVCLLLSTGCQITTPEATNTTSPTISSPTPTNADGSPTADSDPSTINSASQQLAMDLALSEEGLLLVTEDTGSTRLLSFDTERETMTAAVTSVRGEPSEQGTNADCGLEYISWADGLTLYSLNERFVGWSVDGQKAEVANTYTTMASIGIGSTRAELEGAYNAVVEQTSLGTEFSTGGVYGILDGTEANAKVTSIWGGRTCIFR